MRQPPLGVKAPKRPKRELRAERRRARAAQDNGALFEIPLISLSASAVAARRILAGHQISGDLAWGDAPPTYSLDDSLPSGPAKGTAFSIQIGELDVELWIGLDILAHLPQVELYEEDFAALEDRKLALVVEYLLSDQMAELEAQFSASLEILSVRHEVAAPEQGSAFDFAVQGFLGQETVCAKVHAADMAKFATQLAQTHNPKPTRRLGHFQIDTRLVGPLTSFDGSSLETLAEGDVFVPFPGWVGFSTHMHLIVGKQFVQTLQAVPNGFAFAGPEVVLHNLTGRQFDGGLMSDTPAAPATSMSNPQTLVTIELERKQMALADVETLRSGGVVPCDTAKIDLVTLCADGMPFAEGRLVQLEDGVGVQIIRVI